jgi:hypothetical protein
MKTDEEYIQQAIDKALEHAKKYGIKIGKVVATRDDEYAYTFAGKRNGMATLHGKDNAKKIVPFNTVFDVNLVKKYARGAKMDDKMKEKFSSSNSDHGVFTVDL